MSTNISIDETLLTIDHPYITLISPISLRTLSSGVVGAGMGFHSNFVNKHVAKNDYINHHQVYMRASNEQIGINVHEKVGMMTAVEVKYVTYNLYNENDFSIFVVVTAGVGNAVDSSKAYAYSKDPSLGTINTWIFINGIVSDEALVQAVITATEAKAKSLNDLHIYDPVSQTIATGTSTDSILIGATQQGAKLPYAGTATPLGKLIGKAIYQETKRAVLKTTQSV